jgi:hypothetical protein
MAHFALINDNNEVLEVIVIDNSIIDNGDGTENETLGKDYINNTLGLPGNWLQTSYNNNLRGMYAEIGGTYDATYDKFIPISGRLNSEGEYEQAT